MGCRCEQKRLASELDRARRLAKAYARMEGETIAIVRAEDGTYALCRDSESQGREIVEYVTQY